MRNGTTDRAAKYFNKIYKDHGFDHPAGLLDFLQGQNQILVADVQFDPESQGREYVCFHTLIDTSTCQPVTDCT